MTKAHALYFKEDFLLINEEKTSCIFPLDQKDEGIHLGEWKNAPLFAVFSKREGPFVSLRQAFDLFDPQTVQMITRGRHLLHWHNTSEFCGHCGSSTLLDKKEMAKRCTGCENLFYPPTHPVIMVLIEKEDSILLAQHCKGPKEMYSTLAGFVDPGESLEEAVIREVKEEVGLNVKEITYLGSQAWPFPTSLIMAFKASYDSGEITIDENEIQEAGWYTRDNLPPLPPKYSLSWRIINQWIER